jgi:hypothetical protein
MSKNMSKGKVKSGKIKRHKENEIQHSHHQRHHVRTIYRHELLDYKYKKSKYSVKIID